MLPILKYVPEWFPGAGFQRKAREWRVLAQRMVDLPFSGAMRNIVCIVHEITAAYLSQSDLQEAGLFQPSFISYNLNTSNHHRDAAYHRRAVKSMAGTMYTAGSDTVLPNLQTISAYSHSQIDSHRYCSVCPRHTFQS